MDTAKAVSVHTCRRRLRQKGLPARKPARKILLAKETMKRRRSWAKVRQDWTIERWRRVLFSDKCHAEICGGKLQFVRRRVGERYKAECVQRQQNRSVAHCNFWGFITHFDGGITRFENNMNAMRYINKNRHSSELLTEKLQ